MHFSLVPLQDPLEIMLQLVANGRRERLDHLIVNQLLEYYLCNASIEKTQILFKSQLGVRITVEIKPVVIGVVWSDHHKTPEERPHPSRMLNQKISLGLAAIQVIECQYLRIVPSGEIILIKRKPLSIYLCRRQISLKTNDSLFYLTIKETNALFRIIAKIKPFCHNGN